MLFLSPRYWLWPVAGLPLPEFIALQPEFHRAFHALLQLADPWRRIDDPVNRVIEWRLLFPLAAHYVSLPPSVYLALTFLGGFLALGAIARVVWRETMAALPTAAATFNRRAMDHLQNHNLERAAFRQQAGDLKGAWTTCARHCAGSRPTGPAATMPCSSSAASPRKWGGELS